MHGAGNALFSRLRDFIESIDRPFTLISEPRMKNTKLRLFYVQPSIWGEVM